MNLTLDELKAKRVLFCAKDAGGAEVLAAWIDTNLRTTSPHCCLEKPGLDIFTKYFPSLHNIEVDDIDFYSYDVILSSTSGFDSEMEKRVLYRAISLGVHTIVVLDHWAHYTDRLTYNNGLLQVNEIWVQDIYALNIAKQVFNGYPIVLRENEYLKRQVNEVVKTLRTDLSKPSVDGDQALRVLYLSEPSYDERYTETDIQGLLLDFLAKYAQSNARPLTIRYRLHPRQRNEKYESGPIGEYSINRRHGRDDFEAHQSEYPPLPVDLAWAHWVVGVQTSAMIVALEANLVVKSLMPSWVKDIALPHEDITRVYPFASEFGT